MICQNVKSQRLPRLLSWGVRRKHVARYKRVIIYMNPDRRLEKVPWVAVVGEFTTTFCFGCSVLFVPFYYWSSWPELLVGSHFVVVVLGSVATAFALVQRRPASLKIAIVLAAYMVFPRFGTFLKQSVKQSPTQSAHQYLPPT